MTDTARKRDNDGNRRPFQLSPRFPATFSVDFRFVLGAPASRKTKSQPSSTAAELRRLRNIAAEIITDLAVVQVVKGP
jgi:hypothetical protein